MRWLDDGDVRRCGRAVEALEPLGELGMRTAPVADAETDPRDRDDEQEDDELRTRVEHHAPTLPRVSDRR